MENDEMDLSNAILYADSNRGVYIPQHFAESIRRECVQGVSDECWETLERDPCDPDNDWVWDHDNERLWDTWHDVECNAIITDPSTGIRYTLYQDGDLWLVPISE